MGGLVSLGILVLLAALPLGVDVIYDEDGIRVWAAVWKLSILLYPRPPKEKKRKPRTEQEPQPAAPAEESLPQPPRKPEQPETKKEKNGGSLLDFLPFVKLVMGFLGDFRRKLRVDLLEVKLTLAGDDPGNLADSYGRTWAAIGNLQPQLERWLVIKKREIQVRCDFSANQSTILAHIQMIITLGRILALTAVYAFRALMEYLKFTKKRKGGAVNEPEVTEHAGKYHSENP